MGIGDWGLGIGDWGLGIGPNPQSPIPNPQSPIPNPQSPFFFSIQLLKNKYKSISNIYFIKYKPYYGYLLIKFNLNYSIFDSLLLSINLFL